MATLVPRNRHEQEKCEKCDKKGYYKLGICRDCRMIKCKKCKKPMMEKYLNNTICKECLDKMSNKE